MKGPAREVARREDAWPTRAVVDAALADDAWQPLPFAVFIIKLHGRCNLACDYCYMYEMADQSWRDRPVAMTRRVIDQAAESISDHLKAHAELLPAAIIKLHGGEALLAGAEGVDYAATAFRSAVPEGCDAQIALTTNGILLDDREILEVIERQGIHVSVSLDGGKDAHDLHRTYANGRGSHGAVMRGLEAMRQSPASGLLRLVLCTIDVENDPLDVYESLVDVGAPLIDFELPLGNWTERPPALPAGNRGTPYADWLIPIFDRWYHTVPVPVGIRIFENIMALVLGGHSETEGFGLTPAQIVTVDTDGSIQLADTLRSAFDGAPGTGLDVFTGSFEEALLHPGVVARQLGLRGLAPQCQRCSLVEICGGGEYVHRYRADSGFLNPSVYCRDLQKLITHIRDRVHLDLATAVDAR
ncbi:FxsB family cyclophane-forming radical SAM/SPASM peptide maturase [Streptomyces sp. NPDC001537]